MAAAGWGEKANWIKGAGDGQKMERSWGGEVGITPVRTHLCFAILLVGAILLYLSITSQIRHPEISLLQ